MSLEVQKYLWSGKTLDDLYKELGIKANLLDNLVLLNYSQIDSPKTNPIVMECRGLILEKNSWNVVSMGFFRFFNYGEAKETYEKFNFSNAYAVEKVDGSFIQVFWYDNRWYMSTRGTIEGTGNVGIFNFTFRQLFDMTVKQYPNFYDKLNKEFTYIFELVSPENKVVKFYPDKKLYLTGMRNKCNLNEMNYDFLVNESKNLGVDIPKLYSFKDITQLIDLASSLKNMDEGFVCVDYSQVMNGNFQRLKIKNPAYVAISRMKEKSGSGIISLLILVWQGEEAEFLSYFPEFKPLVDRLKNKYNQFLKKILPDVEKAKSLRNESRKDFAMWALSSTCPSLMFLIYDKKAESFKDMMQDMMLKKGEKSGAKFLLNLIGEKNCLEFEIDK